MSPRLVLITAPTQEEARRLAEAAVERRLAACVNIIPGVESVYHWQGRVERDGEWLLVVKTAAEHVDSLQTLLGELHSYDCPECVAVAPQEVAPNYLAWWRENLAPAT